MKLAQEVSVALGFDDQKCTRIQKSISLIKDNNLWNTDISPSQITQLNHCAFTQNIYHLFKKPAMYEKNPLWNRGLQYLYIAVKSTY